jgi:hypothetical protein
VVEDRLVEHQGIFECSPQQLAVPDRLGRVGEADSAGFHQRTDLRQFVPLAILAHAGQHIDVAVLGPGRLLADELDAGLRIHGRIGFGNAGNRRESTG